MYTLKVPQPVIHNYTGFLMFCQPPYKKTIKTVC